MNIFVIKIDPSFISTIHLSIIQTGWIHLVISQRLSAIDRLQNKINLTPWNLTATRIKQPV